MAARPTTPHHEAGHAVATYFRPLAGKTRRITIREEHLSEDALGSHSRGRMIPPVAGHFTDHEQVRAICVVLLAGSEAEMRVRGDDICGGGNDYEQAGDLLDHAKYDAEREAAIRAIPAQQLRSLSCEEIYAEYGLPVVERLKAELEELRVEARDLINDKWACVEALAKEISTHEELDGERVREIIETVEARE